ncbi:MAG: MFS transporter [Rhizobiales bacterium]|nr:MFS transporter [Hyphomicrobiales bacterium]
MLGFVSLFMDMSSEMAHAVLPIFLTVTLGTSVATVGFIDGVAEAVAQVMKLASGSLSDALQSRKWLAVLGYGLSALAKPLFPIAVSVDGVLAARIVDRVGKGIRGSPRDAMVADMTPPEQRGAAYGLRQSLDTVGAVMGPLLAILALGLWQWDVRSVLWLACLPSVAAVLVLMFAVAEPERRVSGPAQDMVRTGWTHLGNGFWLVLALAALVSAARLSEAFLVLKAQTVAMPLSLVPAVMIVMSAVYAASSYPAGVIADATGQRGLFGGALAALFAAHGLLALGSGVAAVIAGSALWGLHMGLSQGLLSKMVADTAPVALRGRCFGLYYFASGAATLAAATAAGMLWDRSGPVLAFGFGAVLTTCALVVLLSQRRAA